MIRISNISILLLISIGLVYSLYHYDPQANLLKIANAILTDPAQVLPQSRAMQNGENDRFVDIYSSSILVDSLQAIHRNDPENPEACFYLGQYSISQEDYEQAIALFEVCTHELSFAHHDLARLQIAAIYIIHDELQQARFQLIQLQTKDPSIESLQDQLLALIQKLT